MAANAAGHAEHVITDPEARYPGAGRHDRSCEIEAEDSRRLLSRMLGGAFADFEVERVHATRRDPNQHFACAGDRARDRGKAEGRAMRFENGRLHRGMLVHHGDSW